MKHLILIASFLLAVLASCTRPAAPMPAPEAPQRDTLATFDTLIQSQPDSAFSLIYDFYTTRTDLTPFDRHYAALLLSEALFKCDYEQSLRAEVQQAQTYFDSLAAAYPRNDDFTILSARSHYMNGVGLMEADSVVEACSEYLKALEIMEEHFEEKEQVGYNARFMALTYNRLGDLFSDQFMTEQALICYKNASSFYKKCTTPRPQLSNAMYQIGLHFHMLNQSDSAKYYFFTADTLLSDTNVQIYRDIKASEALLLYETEHKADKALSYLSQVASMAESDKEFVSRLLPMSEIFYKEGCFDSAIIYSDSVFNSNIDTIYKAQAAQYLNKIYTAKGNKLMADQYANFLSLFVIDGYEQRNIDSQLVGFFNNYHRQTIVSKHKSEKRILWFKSLIIIGLLIFVIIPFLVYIQKRDRMKAVNEVGNKLIQNQLQYTALINKLLKKNAKLSENRQTLASKKENVSLPYIKKQSIDDYNELVNEPICYKLVNRFTENDIITSNKSSYYKDLSATEKDLKRLDKVIEKHCPDFINRVYCAHPCLENGELEMCKFFLIGLNEKQIAVLLQKNYSTFYRYSNSFKEKTACTDIKEHLKTILFERNNDTLQEKV